MNKRKLQASFFVHKIPKYDISYSITWGGIVERLKKGDIVVRISYNKDILFEIEQILLNKNNTEIYILKGIEETSKNTIELIKLIQSEMESYKTEFVTKLPKIYSDELLDSLFYEVYTRINYIEDKCGVTRQTAATYLNSLVDAGLLEYEKVGRESIYKNTRLIDLLSKF